MKKTKWLIVIAIVLLICLILNIMSGGATPKQKEKCKRKAEQLTTKYLFVTCNLRGKITRTDVDEVTVKMFLGTYSQKRLTGKVKVFFETSDGQYVIETNCKKTKEDAYYHETQIVGYSPPRIEEN